MPHPKAKALKRARGQRWGRLLKVVYSDCAKDLADSARMLRDAQEGKLTPLDIGILAELYDLHFKNACEWCEEQEVLPIGTYNELRDRGLKVSKCCALARALLQRAEANLA
jgi:hypothetical protein